MTAATPMLRPPWAGLDDAALLAHFRGPRDVRYYPVADAEETRPEKIDALLHGDFEFNRECHHLPDPIDWLANPSADIEWHILLHKFYYAVGLGLAFQRSGDTRYVQRWVTLIDGWMRSTPAGFIAADVTGRRVQNWIYSLHLFVGHAANDTGPLLTPDFHRRLLESLHEQVEFLCANLTPKRNHRTLELYAIFLAGVVFPEMQRAAHWREFALAETVANLQADLLPDGVHCELSTDYHHLVLKNALNFRRLAALNGVVVPAAFDTVLEKGLEFSLHVHKPDGIVPSLSDGDARSYLDLLQQGAELFNRDDMRYVASGGTQGHAPAQRVAHFADSGYTVLRSHWGDDGRRFADAQHLVFDCGPVGEGNHGHFDCLSFELAAHGRSLVVDPGRYTYSEAGETNWRVRFRSTAAHNTVCVDDRPQTRYVPKPIKPGTRHAAGTVRHKIAGPAPEATLLERHHGATLDLLHGRARSHEYDAVHERCMVFVDRRYWIVGDALRAPTPHDYRLNFQLSAMAEGRVRLDSHGASHRARSPGLLLLQPARHGVQAAVRPGWVSASYGEKQAAPALQFDAHGGDVDFDSVLVPWLHDEPAVEVDQVLVVPARSGTARSALRIRHSLGGQTVIDHWFHGPSPVAEAWHVGDLAFEARWAFWRLDAAGHLLHAVSHDGARLPQWQAQPAEAL